MRTRSSAWAAAARWIWPSWPQHCCEAGSPFAMSRVPTSCSVDNAWLACIPTTAGTGSEVSPIAILLDEHTSLKKGRHQPTPRPGRRVRGSAADGLHAISRHRCHGTGCAHSLHRSVCEPLRPSGRRCLCAGRHPPDIPKPHQCCAKRVRRRGANRYGARPACMEACAWGR